MIYTTLQSEVDAYFESTAISNSKLKLILKGMEEYNKTEWEEKKMYYEEKGFIIVGNGVDVLLTQGKESFREQFYVSTAEKPSGKGLSVIMYLYDRVKENYENQDIVTLTFDRLDETDILLACDAEDYYSNRRSPSRIGEVAKQADFFNELTGAHGKQIIDYSDYVLMENIVKSLQTHMVTKKYFPVNDEQVHEDIDLYYQVPLYFIYQGVPAKALLDLIVVNHMNNTIIPVDLKTMGGYTSSFMYQAMRMRYDIQAAWYSNALRSVDLSIILHGIENQDEYTIEPFKFIVESTKVQGTPIIYTADETFLNMGRYGRLEGIVDMWSRNGENEAYDIASKIHHAAVHGYEQAFELYLWHEENGYSFDKDYIESGGQFILGWNRKEPVRNEV